MHLVRTSSATTPHASIVASTGGDRVDRREDLLERQHDLHHHADDLRSESLITLHEVQ
jgi:hypothetical protein